MPLSSKVKYGVIIALLLTGCTSVQQQSSQLNSQPNLVGSGKYHYRLVLIDAATGDPASYRPFALSGRDIKLPFVSDEKGVYQGVTNSKGEVPIIALTVEVKPDDLFLRERFGSGPYGEQFRMIDSYDDTPHVGRPYTILACTARPQHFQGYSDKNGYTAYAATKSPNIHLLLFNGHIEPPESSCK